MSAKYEKITTPVFRVSFPSVFTPTKNPQTGALFYEVTCLFDVKDKALLNEMSMAVERELVNKFGPDKTRWPKGLKLPFSDGNIKYNKNPESYPMYKNQLVVKLKTQMQPGIRNASATADITDPKEFYAGCYARATCIAKYWKHEASHSEGVHFLLNNLQKVKDGEPFGGTRNPSDDFTAIPGAVAQGPTTDFDPLGGIGA